jgi:glutamyl-tRNA synthetase
LSASDSTVVTRFAPSPTGFLHIGGARTALFNWLFARHHGGKFLLRIEDTDRARSTGEAIDAILDGMNWLELDWDGHEYYQSQFWARHAEIAHRLLDRGAAYRCYMTQEELAAQREAAQRERRPFRINSPWRDVTDGQGDKPFVVRLKAPRDGETVIDDRVQGRVTVQNVELDDFVLLRSDGTPTYMLAVVVDDHDMGVTHVIRGDDHLNNAARQSLIYQALEWQVPAFAHLPLIHGPDGAKLSKRHGAQAVSEFADLGYLPEGMRNYLARLGWGHGDDEIFTDAQAIEWFDVADVVKAPARLDWDKLNHTNAQHLRVADDLRLAGLTLSSLARSGHALPGDADVRIERTIPLVKEGAKTIVELGALCLFALKLRPLELDERTRNLLTDETRGRLSRLAETLANVGDWGVPKLELALREFAAAEGVGMGKFGPALRGVLSGGASAPDLASALAALGKDEALGRLNDALCTAA